MLSNRENVSAITQVFDTMAECTMLSPEQPDKTDVHPFPVVRHQAPTGHLQSHPVTQTGEREAAARALVSINSMER